MTDQELSQFGEDAVLFSEEGSEQEYNDSDSETVDQLSQSKLLALTLVMDAWTDRRYDYKEDPVSLRNYSRFNGYWLKKIFLLSSVILLCLVFFEKPTWSVLLFSPIFTIIAEVAVLGVFVLRLVAMHSFLKPMSFWKDPKVIVCIVTLTMMVVDIAIYVLSVSLNISPILRWTRPLRPVLVICSHRQVRTAVSNVLRSIKDMLIMVSLLALLIAITTLFFFVMFRKREGYLTSPIDTFYELYCLLTTDTFPDMMMPVYDVSGWYAFVFIGYLMIGYYFFMTVVLAIVYLNYRNFLKNDVKESVSSRLQYLDRAFNLLTDGKQFLDKSSFKMLYSRLVPKATPDQIEINWQLLDETDRGSIDKMQFRSIVNVLYLKLTQEKTSRNVFDRFFPHVYRSKISRTICKLVKTKMFKHVFSTVILVNALFIALSIEVETIFLSIYWLEILLKLYAYGWMTFIRSGWNRFDLIVMSAGVIVAIVSAFLSIDETWRDVILCLRVIRLVKVLSTVNSYRRLIHTMSKVAPSLIVYMVVLLMLFYSFGIVGMEIWAGKMTPSNPLLQNTTYASNDMWRNNFDDFPNALVVLFELMIVQSWDILVAGFVAVSSDWARVYFILFHLLTNILFVNIIVAFILEGFLVQYQLYDNMPKDRIDQRMRDLQLKIITKDNEEEVWESVVESESDAVDSYYRVVKKSSTLFFLERLFQNDLELDDVIALQSKNTNTALDTDIVLEPLIEEPIAAETPAVSLGYHANPIF